jgi:serine/threonine-protein kinase
MEILGKLSHPGIVTFLEATNDGESLGFAMEFVDGCSLQELLQSRGALAWEDAIALAIQICQPLKHAHDRGVIHRDLKPSNILVKGWPDCPQVKLTDFGVASLFASRKLTAAGWWGRRKPSHRNKWPASPPPREAICTVWVWSFTP